MQNSSQKPITFPKLPILECLDPVRANLQSNNRLVIQAPPGAGKTTIIPLALLEESWAQSGKILMLEPRRLAARSAARHMSSLLGEKVGETVGYRVQMESCVSDKTRIEIVTEGILTRRLQHDPELSGIAAIIFDEFHERSLNADLGLALCLDSQEGLREDLKLIIMSATLDGAGIAKLLASDGLVDAPIVTSEGRAFPVETKYLGKPNTLSYGRPDLIGATTDAIRKALKEETGSVLVFLPGEGEIRKVEAALKPTSLPAHIYVTPLFGAMPLAEQDKAISPAEKGKRKIVLATNIAETSLTINGIRIVIDSGYRRLARYNPNNGLTRLETKMISLASAIQREGRAGRVETGVCYRLWDQNGEGAMQQFDRPEILEADLTGLALDLANWGVVNDADLKWLDCPTPALLSQARSLLRQLGAITADFHITPHGKKLSSLPMHPRLAHMILKAHAVGFAKEACDMAALISERDLLNDRNRADFRLRVEALPRHPFGKRIRTLSSHWFKRLPKTATPRLAIIDDHPESLAGLLLSLAYPDRIALRRAGQEARFQLANGRGARLDNLDALSPAKCLCIADLTGDGRESLVRMAAPIDIDLLQAFYQDGIETGSFATWDKRSRSILARKQQRLGRLVLQDGPSDDLPADQIETALFVGIRDLGLSCLPWEKESESLLQRLRVAHRLAPDQWPDVSDISLLASLEKWLSPYLAALLPTARKLEHLKTLALKPIIMGLLDWSQQQALDDFIPSHWPVPSGSRVRIDYSNEESPILAVKLQEMFGATETPKIGKGRLALTLHLLSPARRPLQVTQDLVSFWANGYHAVKAENKGLYRRHPWPDDPMTHKATAKTKARM